MSFVACFRQKRLTRILPVARFLPELKAGTCLCASSLLSPSSRVWMGGPTLYISRPDEQLGCQVAADRVKLIHALPSSERERRFGRAEERAWARAHSSSKVVGSSAPSVVPDISTHLLLVRIGSNGAVGYECKGSVKLRHGSLSLRAEELSLAADMSRVFTSGPCRLALGAAQPRRALPFFPSRPANRRRASLPQFSARFYADDWNMRLRSGAWRCERALGCVESAIAQPRVPFLLNDGTTPAAESGNLLVDAHSLRGRSQANQPDGCLDATSATVLPLRLRFFGKRDIFGSHGLTPSALGALCVGGVGWGFPDAALRRPALRWARAQQGQMARAEPNRPKAFDLAPLRHSAAGPATIAPKPRGAKDMKVKAEGSHQAKASRQASRRSPALLAKSSKATDRGRVVKGAAKSPTATALAESPLHTNHLFEQSPSEKPRSVKPRSKRALAREMRGTQASPLAGLAPNGRALANVMTELSASVSDLPLLSPLISMVRLANKPRATPTPAQAAQAAAAAQNKLDADALGAAPPSVAPQALEEPKKKKPKQTVDDFLSATPAELLGPIASSGVHWLASATGVDRIASARHRLSLPKMPTPKIPTVPALPRLESGGRKMPAALERKMSLALRGKLPIGRHAATATVPIPKQSDEPATRHGGVDLRLSDPRVRAAAATALVVVGGSVVYKLSSGRSAAPPVREREEREETSTGSPIRLKYDTEQVMTQGGVITERINDGDERAALMELMLGTGAAGFSLNRLSERRESSVHSGAPQKLPAQKLPAQKWPAPGSAAGRAFEAMSSEIPASDMSKSDGSVRASEPSM